MDKPYSGKVLVEKLKESGLDVAEDAAKVVVDSVLDWVKESAQKSENKVDDVIANLIDPIKPYIDEQLDKIDGEKG